MVRQFAPSNRQVALVVMEGPIVETGYGKTIEECLWEITELLKGLGFKRVAYAWGGGGVPFGLWKEYEGGLPSWAAIQKRKATIRKNFMEMNRSTNSLNGVPSF